MRHVFADRRAAGRTLAQALMEMSRQPQGPKEPVVLALPRGGVPVGLEVSLTLKAPLDLVMVRKIGVPWHPELAAAAVVDGDDPRLVINEDVVRAAGVGIAELEAGRDREVAEIERRRATYLRGRTPVPLACADAIVVDDGIATGATVRAALQAVRSRGPRSLTLAVPVAAREAVVKLRPEVDALVCLEMPTPFHAIGAHYADFEQVSDSDVIEMLRAAERISVRPR